MKFFVEDDKRRIEFGEDNWVDIKFEMSIGDWDKYEASMLQYEAESGGENGNRAARRRAIRGRTSNQEEVTMGKLKISAGYIDLMEINILEWSFHRPLNRGSIEKLTADVSDIIVQGIEEQNPESPLAQTTSQTETASSSSPSTLSEVKAPSS